ncbi:MAG: DUF3318 domain-containing protein [Leptolyngbyaceae cyanobacterium SM1_1_3]|nr:DUF3318 domain-containing protein [Leptolyngbyaceae cyanobacterium SM1_1_3]NJN01545.1 DUF3318 domain-containing protein [Leptolyngbyaceae cyanobacterium RM1_1_2]NJO09846.1 DUF3318 domain-containing protein [Leptolyngbyaceae cyanobacterium SL_1_1]
MVNSNREISRLLELLPASARIKVRLKGNPAQTHIIESDFPLPWKRTQPITFNFDLWSQLSAAQQDLLLLHQVCWLTRVQLLKFDLYQGLAAAGLLGTVLEAVQLDAIGVVISGSLSAFAGTQIWRNSHGPRAEIEADEAAIAVAQRRGYSQLEAARHLAEAIEATARIEGRPSLSFSELLRLQNLKAIAGLSPTGVPNSVRQ